MPTAEVSSLILSVGVAVIAALLIGWQWVEHRRRQADLTNEDALHFSLQETRRSVVAATMFLLAAGLYAGARIEPKIGGRPNVLFVQVWLGITLLVILLLVLALVDWLATRRYARRQRHAIVREGLEILRDGLRLRISRQDNREPAAGPESPLDS